MSYSNPNQLNEIIQQPYAVDISQFLSRGWQIFTKNAWGFIGFFFLNALINVGLSKIEVIGAIASVIISGVLTAGYFFVSFKIAKGSQTEFGDFFKGFNNIYFLPLFLVNLVKSIFLGFLYLASAISFGIAFYNYLRITVNSILSSSSAEVPPLPELPIPPALTLVLFLLGLLLLFSAIYLEVSYTFAIPLIVDKKIGFWDALETSRQLITKKWFPFFGFLLVLFLINLGGLMAFFVGIVLTVPLTINAVAAAYESIVGLSSSSDS